MFSNSAPKQPSPLLRSGVVSRVQSWGAGLIDLIYPPLCAYCGALPADGESRPDDVARENRPAKEARELLCPECLAAMVDHQPACSACGGVLPMLGDRHLACPRCAQKATRFDKLLRLGRYEGPLREAVLRTKSPFGAALGMALAAALARERREAFAALRIDVVSPIPIYWTRRLARGAHGPETIAAALARRLGLPLDCRLLGQQRPTRSQHELTPPQRRANVRGAFVVAKRRSLQGARVLVVDDVLTTGATANEAARVLHRAGAALVAVAVLARTQSSDG